MYTQQNRGNGSSSEVGKQGKGGRKKMKGARPYHRAPKHKLEKKISKVAEGFGSGFVKASYRLAHSSHLDQQLSLCHHFLRQFLRPNNNVINLEYLRDMQPGEENELFRRVSQDVCTEHWRGTGVSRTDPEYSRIIEIEQLLSTFLLRCYDSSWRFWRRLEEKEGKFVIGKMQMDEIQLFRNIFQEGIRRIRNE